MKGSRTSRRWGKENKDSRIGRGLKFIKGLQPLGVTREGKGVE